MTACGSAVSHSQRHVSAGAGTKTQARPSAKNTSDPTPALIKQVYTGLVGTYAGTDPQTIGQKISDELATRITSDWTAETHCDSTGGVVTYTGVFMCDSTITDFAAAKFGVDVGRSDHGVILGSPIFVAVDQNGMITRLPNGAGCSNDPSSNLPLCDNPPSSPNSSDAQQGSPGSSASSPSATTNSTTTTSPDPETGFTPGDHNPSDGHASDCARDSEIGPHSDCSVEMQVRHDLIDHTFSVPGSDTVTDGANMPGASHGLTITFDCSRHVHRFAYIRCQSKTNAADWFRFAETDLMVE